MVKIGSTIKAVQYSNGVCSDVVELTAKDKPFIRDCGSFKDDAYYHVIEMICGLETSEIYYTLDGSIPTKTSLKYNAGSYKTQDGSLHSSIKVPQGKTIKAIVFYNDYSSDVVSLSVPVSKPRIKDYGAWISDTSYHIIGIESEGEVYFSTTGNASHLNGNLYSSNTSEYLLAAGGQCTGIKLSENSTVKAISFANNTESAVSSYTVFASPKIFDLGALKSDVDYHVIDFVGSGNVYYTTDGTTPTSSSYLYSDQKSMYELLHIFQYGVPVQTGLQVKAVSIIDGASSGVTSLIVGYSAPSIVDHGVYKNNPDYHVVEIIGSGSLYYTEDGSTPNSSSKSYSGNKGNYLIESGSSFNGVLISAGNIVKAVAYNSLYSLYSSVTSCSIVGLKIIDHGAYNSVPSYHVVEITGPGVIRFTTGASNTPSSTNGLLYESEKGTYLTTKGTSFEGILVPYDVPVKAVSIDNGVVSNVYSLSLSYKYYHVNLKNQWKVSDNGGYESFSNNNQWTGKASMTMKFIGYDSFSIKIKSEGLQNSDYTIVSEANSNGTKASTTLNNTWETVTYTGLDPYTLYEITITYDKKSSGVQGENRGYLQVIE